jgi:hypothetical protein
MNQRPWRRAITARAGQRASAFSLGRDSLMAKLRSMPCFRAYIRDRCSWNVGAVPSNPDPRGGQNVDAVLVAAFRATHVEKLLVMAQMSCVG